MVPVAGLLSLGIRPRERGRFGFFALLLALMACALAVGTTATEALLLGLLGVKALPVTIMVASVGAVAGSLAYTGLVGRLRHDRLLALLLLGVGLLVLLGWLALGWLPAALVLPALFSLSALAMAVLGNHYWVLAGDSFDALAQKRIFPRLSLGMSLGGFVGGVLASTAGHALSARALLLLWAGLLGLASLLVLALGRRLATWSSGQPLAGEPLRERLFGSVRFLRRSRLARGLLGMLAGMVLSLALAQYCYSDLFASHFERTDQLASFLGVLVAAAYLVEIPFLAGLTPWLLQRAGVPLTTLLHPLLAVLAFLGLGLDYSLLAALFAWSVHRMFQNCLGSPARSLVYNAFPGRFRPRLRAFLEGVVSYAARALAGGLLLLVQGWLRPSQLVWPGLLLALGYLAGALSVRGAYLGALLEEINRGGVRSDLPLPPERLAIMGEAALEAGDLGSVAAQAHRLPPELLRRALAHPQPGVRAVAARALGTAVPATALEDPVPAVRLAALPGASENGRRLLLQDPDPDVRAAAAASLPEEGRPVLENLLESAPQVALSHLPSQWASLGLPFLGHPEPGLRGLALSKLGPGLSLGRLEGCLEDPSAEVRRTAARALGHRSDPLALQILARGLADEAREVRLEAARGLAQAGPSGARAAEAALRAPRLATVEAAVLASGEEALRGELRGLLREARRELSLLHGAPAGDEPPARLLRAALQDRVMRARRLALALLERLEGPEAVGGVRRRLRVGTPRERAEALDALSNLGDRESAAVLVELLDEQTAAAGPVDLEELRAHHPDRRVRLAAAGMLEGWPADLSARQERLLRLQQLPLLSGFGLEELEQMLSRGGRERFQAGQTLFQAGQPADRFYVLLDGEVEHQDRRLEPVALLGEISVLDGGARRQPARALTPVELVSWAPEQLFGWVRERPELALELFRSLTGKLREAERRLSGARAPDG